MRTKLFTILSAVIFIAATANAQTFSTADKKQDQQKSVFTSDPDYQKVNSVNERSSRAIIDSLHYDGPNGNAIGTNSPAVFGVYASFPASVTANYSGDSIVEMKYYINGATDVNSIELQIFEDTTNAPVYTQTVSSVNDGWNSTPLTSAYVLSNQEIFVGYELDASGGLPAGTDTLQGNPNGQWMYFQGSWGKLVDLAGIDANWNIRAMIDGTLANDDVAVSELVAPQNGNNLTASEDVKVKIDNIGVNSQSGVSVTCEINGATTLTGTTDTINSGASETVTLTPQADFSTPNTVYDLKIYTSLAADVNPNNDTLETTVVNTNCGYSCPPNAISETEVCGDSTNNGCNLTTAQFASISFGDTICGTSYLDTAGNRDTDWYEFTVDSVMDVQAIATTTFQGALLFVDHGDCSNASVITSTGIDKCGADTLTTTLAAGDYVVFVAPDFNAASFNCSGENIYSLTIESIGMPTSYCEPTSDCSYGDGFEDFILKDINNTGSGCSTDGYGDFTSMTTNLGKGVTYPVTMKSGYDNNHVSIWIDFNDNYYFEASEKVLDDFVLSTGGTSYTDSITIPASAPLGNHRLRAKAVYDANPDDPCANSSYGETEDYMIEVDNSSGNKTVAFKELNIYPNPANNEVYIENAINADISVINVMGQEVISKTAQNNKEMINTSNLSEGSYIIRVKDDEKVTTRKVSVVR